MPIHFAQIAQEVRRLGLNRTFWKILKQGQIKPGTLVGTDRFGNEYFENREEILGRDRWVEYAGEPEGSQIPAEWHAWLHHSQNVTPKSEVLEKELRPFYEREHTPNMTGTGKHYVPTNHILKRDWKAPAPKIEAWQPPSVNLDRKEPE